jgi:hypothetical protein
MSIPDLLFPIPTSRLIDWSHYTQLCDAVERGFTVYIVMPDGTRHHMNRVSFDVVGSGAGMFRVVPEPPQREYASSRKRVA